jgi:phosphate uptake regulator
VDARKLQRAGKSTFLVSLPRGWVTGAGLRAGDTLYVDPEPDGSVTVRQAHPGRPDLRTASFETGAGESREHLLRRLLAAYATGADLFEVRFPAERSAFVREVARDFARRLVGPELIEEGEGTVVLRDLADPTELGPEAVLRRMHVAVRGMLEDAGGSFAQGGLRRTGRVEARAPEVARLYWRVTKQSSVSDARWAGRVDRDLLADRQSYRRIAMLFRRVAEASLRIARIRDGLPDDLVRALAFRRDLGEAAAETQALLDRAFRAALRHSATEANGVLDDGHELRTRLDVLEGRIATACGPPLGVLGGLIERLGSIVELAEEMAEEALALAALPTTTRGRE